jgi:isoleucyl-tRNA synthetase
MFHIAEAMVRWLAPILSFTAEEIWAALPGDRPESVFLSAWYEIPGAAGPAQAIDWPLILKVREAVSRELERLRNDDVIGSALDAEVALFCEASILERLRPLGDELRFVFITSEATVGGLDARPPGAVEVEGFGAGKLYVAVTRSEFDKCARCWHRRADVGADAAHPEICGRCIGNIEGPGEQRQFA